MENASGKPLSTVGDGFPFINPGTSQKVAYDGSTRSTAFGARTTLVRLIASTDCHVAVGSAAAPTTPTAAADGTCVFLKAGIEYYLGVIPSSKLAAIKDVTGGNLFITEGA